MVFFFFYFFVANNNIPVRLAGLASSSQPQPLALEDFPRSFTVATGNQPRLISPAEQGEMEGVRCGLRRETCGGVGQHLKADRTWARWFRDELDLVWFHRFFLSLCHIKKNLIILEYQIKYIYNFFIVER